LTTILTANTLCWKRSGPEIQPNAPHYLLSAPHRILAARREFLKLVLPINIQFSKIVLKNSGINRRAGRFTSALFGYSHLP